MKKCLLFSIIFLSFFSCQKKEDKATNQTGNKEAVTLKFWVSPDRAQEIFWKEVVDKWNKENTDIKVNLSTIPTSDSSEETILNSIASGTNPDMSTNIFSGFAAQLISLDQIYNLKSLDGWDELIKKRKMENIISSWEKDGKVYVLPEFINPTIVSWRKDMLDKLGLGIPKTFSDILALGEKFENSDLKSEGKYVMVVAGSNNWWDRWFDFITYYFAATDGKKYIENEKMTFNNSESIEILKFMREMYKKGYYTKGLKVQDLYDGNVIGVLSGANNLKFGQTQFPDLMDKIVVGPVPTSEEKTNVSTFGDIKGLVIFKSTKHLQEVWSFVKWVYGNDDFSKKWLDLVGLPPARGDLLTNEKFKDFYSKTPDNLKYVQVVGNAHPTALIGNTPEVQGIMTKILIDSLFLTDESAESLLSKAEEEINAKLQEN